MQFSTRSEVRFGFWARSIKIFNCWLFFFHNLFFLLSWPFDENCCLFGLRVWQFLVSGVRIAHLSFLSHCTTFISSERLSSHTKSPNFFSEFDPSDLAQKPNLTSDRVKNCTEKILIFFSIYATSQNLQFVRLKLVLHPILYFSIQIFQCTGVLQQ